MLAGDDLKLGLKAKFSCWRCLDGKWFEMLKYSITFGYFTDYLVYSTIFSDFRKYNFIYFLYDFFKVMFCDNVNLKDSSK